MKPKAIILDIDGVILNTDFIFQEIHELGLKGDEMWDYFYQHCNSDRVKVIEETKKYIDSFVHATYEVEVEPNVITIDSVALIISTARNEKCASETKRKLEENGILFKKLYMREYDDLSPASCVKREHLERIMKEFDIIAFIDDDLTNCRMAKEFGILALRRV